MGRQVAVRGTVTRMGAALVAASLLASCSPGASTTTGTTTTGTPSGQTRSSPAKGVTRASTVWRPESARLPLDLPRRESACPATPRPGGWVRVEAGQGGDPGFQVPPDGWAGQVVGYADRRSATCGDIVQVALSGPNAVVRLVWQSGEVRVQPRPVPPVQPGTRQREAAWPVSVTVPVTAAWPPGFYLLVPHAAGGAGGPGIPLVVRDDVDGTPVLFAASSLTWNAYNDWAGYSLYRGPGRTANAQYLSRAKVVSFRRPLVGSGYRQLTYMDLPVVQELERIAAETGVDVAYTTDVDLDQQPSQLLRHAEVVFGGHAEYWTRRAYDAVAAARNAGVNLAFLGANNLWWHTRLGTSPGAPEPDREIVYRVQADDPASRSADFTLLWSQWPEHRDAAAMLGQSHSAINVHGGYQLLGAPAWMLTGTGLSPGTVDRPGSTLPLAVGNEADGYVAAGANPGTLTVVAAGVLRGARGPAAVSASYYVAPSGAGVFAAGTTDWSCGLAGPCSDQHAPASTTTALRGLTKNIVLAFATPRAGRTHPSTPGVTPPPAVLLSRLAPEAIGTYGSGSEPTEERGGKKTRALASGGA
jgi:hypothetical protein